MGRYLVTGGVGFIGSHLVEHLLETGHEVTILDDTSSDHDDQIPRAAALILEDVSNPATVAEVMAGHDGCFHLAAIASTERSREEWAHTQRVNVGGTVAVFDAARQAADGAPIPVVYASSAAVYGDNPAVPLAEDAAVQPLTAYCVDKLACEQYARIANRVHGVPVTGFRLFNIYGPRQHPSSPYSGIISLFANRIANGEPITIFGDGELERDFVYVGDVIQYLMEAMARPAAGAPIFNVCTGQATSVNQLVKLLGELLGREPIIERCETLPDGDIRVSVGDPRRLMQEFGFACDTGLRDGLLKTLK